MRRDGPATDGRQPHRRSRSGFLDRADREAREAVKQATIAQKQTEIAQKQTELANVKTDEARRERSEAVKQKELADQQRALAEAAQKKEEYGAYVARIGLAAAKVVKGMGARGYLVALDLAAGMA